MKRAAQLTAKDLRRVNGLVEYFKANEGLFHSLLDQLVAALQRDKALFSEIHSLKWRVKDPEHLGDKLRRKLVSSKSDGAEFELTKENLFEKINDLAGCRILHLHTRQFRAIDAALKRIFDEYRYELAEGPFARTWDDESRQMFVDLGVQTRSSPSLYTSVHYVIAPNRRTRMTCEIQVRTLAEELWGEVDHTLNYPKASESIACREQIKVLARLTSGCTRLVDSIFSTHEEFVGGLAERSGAQRSRRRRR